MIYTNGNLRGYEALKHTAKELHLKIPELLVLARQNDPFFCGTPTQTEMASWFADLWQRFGYTTGVHLRRVHYRLVNGEKQPKKHNGEAYENTENCWTYLCDAGKQARYLGLVDAHAFEDRRNPDPVQNGGYGEDFGPYLEKPDWIEFDLPSINRNIAWNLSLRVPSMYVAGYDYGDSAQPYHVEVWAEKSSQNDVLLPVCQLYSVNLVTSLGYQSITSVVELLQRVSRSNKPARVLYISDFDPAGDGMPVAVARQLEYWRSEYAPDAEIKLQPVVLTREQVQSYSLPRIPIKETDRSKGKFENKYGEGATELDALQAIYPGELANIITEAILPYRDLQLSQRYQRAEKDAQEVLSEQWEELTDAYQEELSELQKSASDIVQGYQERLSLLNDSLQSELEPISERLDSVRQAIQELVDDFEPELPGLPEPKTPDQDEAAWLFDSEREYFDQLVAYKVRQAG